MASNTYQVKEEVTVTCLIERPNGTTYTQDIIAKSSKQSDIDKAVESLKRTIGRTYYVCDYWF